MAETSSVSRLSGVGDRGRAFVSHKVRRHYIFMIFKRLMGFVGVVYLGVAENEF